MSRLTPSEIDNANRRRRTSGYTRFQEAIEEGSLHSAHDWIGHEKCPFNRLGRDGKPPLASAAARMHSTLKYERSEVGPMPDWWQKIYPNHTQEDWVRHRSETDQKMLAMAQEVFDACLQHVDWTQWKSAQVAEFLDALPPGVSADNPRRALIDRAIEAGLPLDKLEYNGHRVTPAMNALLRHPYRMEGLAWMEMDPSIEPPGDGPGLLSVAFMQWSRGLIRERGYWEQLTELALQRGASINRPTCGAEWIDAGKQKEDRLYGLRTYSPPRSLLAQMHELDSPRLLACVSEHHIDDNNRIDSLMTLMRRTGEIHRRRSTSDDSARMQEHTDQLLRMLAGPAGNDSTWRKMGSKLMETYIKDLWPYIPSSNPMSTSVRKRLMVLTGNPTVDPTVCQAAAHAMTLNLRVFEMQENIEEAAEDFARMGLPRTMFFGQVVAALVDGIMSSEYRHAKSLAALELLLASDPGICQEVHDDITKSLFKSPSGGLPVAQMAPMVQMLEDNGWKASAAAWGMLHHRLGDLEGRDNADVLIFLGDVAGRHAPLGQATLFNPIFPADHDSDKRYRGSGYEEVCRWDRGQSLRAHAHILRQAIGSVIDCNARIWEKGSSLLEECARYMKRCQKEGDAEGLAMLRDLVPVFHRAGAHPDLETLEDGSPAQWFAELPPTHPFHEAWTVVVEQQLQAHTVEAGRRGRAARL